MYSAMASRSVLGSAAVRVEDRDTDCGRGERAGCWPRGGNDGQTDTTDRQADMTWSVWDGAVSLCEEERRGDIVRADGHAGLTSEGWVERANYVVGTDL